MQVLQQDSANPPLVDEYGFYRGPKHTVGGSSNSVSIEPEVAAPSPRHLRRALTLLTVTRSAPPQATNQHQTLPLESPASVQSTPLRSKSTFHLAAPAANAFSGGGGSMSLISASFMKGRTASMAPTTSETKSRCSVPAAALERERMWLKLLDSGVDLKKGACRKQVKRLCRDGAPASLRGQIWTRLILGGVTREADLFDHLMNKQRQIGDTLEIFDVIERDVVTHLRGILRCYALYNPALGYTQGMGFIVGMLLMQIPCPEDVFWVLVGMIDGICKGFYEADLRRVRLDAKVFDLLVRNMDPKLFKHLEANQVDGMMFIPQWFLTLFTSSLPWASVLRIWDMFFCEGSKALFRMSLAIVVSNRDHLLRCPSTSEILTFILHLPAGDPKFHPEMLSKFMMRVRLRTRNLEKLRKHVEETACIK
ncbi:hypothetical protein CcCBS67573_g01552 [Chytriomyces confervae]|uniref:Rab-GAP TBC domain-containing protein n=1 Tax=Chytriomyces confervae TaxID=246404 RepID=A0A507FLJ9_9FUNG|nr:hypothetical protein CcCBS67573_g01552 [Chytriomyces confervae]